MYLCETTLLRRAVHKALSSWHGRAYAAHVKYRVHTAASVSPQNLQLGKDIDIKIQTVIETPTTTLRVVVADCDAVMQMYIDAGQGDRDPYWTCVWPSSVAMAQEILDRPHLVAGRRVADLGCGLGVGGIAAALAGAEEVVFLDREPLAIQCALLNARLNGFNKVKGLRPELENLDHGAAEVDTRAFEAWTALGLTEKTNTDSPHIRIPNICWSVFDWSARLDDAVMDRFDVVLACDVLYEQFSVEPVSSVVPKLLRGHGGKDSRLLLCDPPLRAKHNRDAFIRLLNEQGYVAEECADRQASVFNETKRVFDKVPIVFMSFRLGSIGDTVGIKSFG